MITFCFFLDGAFSGSCGPPKPKKSLSIERSVSSEKRSINPYIFERDVAPLKVSEASASQVKITFLKPIQPNSRIAVVFFPYLFSYKQYFMVIVPSFLFMDMSEISIRPISFKLLTWVPPQGDQFSKTLTLRIPEGSSNSATSRF